VEYKNVNSILFYGLFHSLRVIFHSYQTRDKKNKHWNMFQLIYFILKLYQDLLKNNTRLFFLFYKSIKIKGPFPKS